MFLIPLFSFAALASYSIFSSSVIVKAGLNLKAPIRKEKVINKWVFVNEFVLLYISLGKREKLVLPYAIYRRYRQHIGFWEYRKM